MARYLLIVNPTSGRGFAGRSLPVLEQEMKKYNLDYKLVLTERPWQAADLAEQGAREGAEFVKQHIIQVTGKAFDDFADAGTDRAANRKMLGLG